MGITDELMSVRVLDAKGRCVWPGEAECILIPCANNRSGVEVHDGCDRA